MNTDEDEESRPPEALSAGTSLVVPAVAAPEPTAAPAPAAPPGVQNPEILAAKRLIEEQLVAAGLRQVDPMEKIKALAAKMAPTGAPLTAPASSGPVDPQAAIERLQQLAATMVDPVSEVA